MKIEEVKFPVVALARSSAITVYESKELLTKCFNRALANGYFENLFIIDSNCLGIEVMNAEKIGTVGGLWGYDIFLDQTIRVKLLLNNTVEQLSLDEVKNKILSTINENRSFWSSGESVAIIQSKITSARNMLDLINILSHLLN